MEEIIKYLKERGEQLDSEIAEGTGMSLEKVRLGISKLSARGDLVMCRVIRVKDGEQVQGMLYRAAGFTPKPKPGRKVKGSIGPETGN